MNDNFEQMDFRIIMESCMDLASAIEQKNRQDISYDFYGIVELGRIAHFLRSLMRKDTDNEVGTAEEKKDKRRGTKEAKRLN